MVIQLREEEERESLMLIHMNRYMHWHCHDAVQNYLRLLVVHSALYWFSLVNLLGVHIRLLCTQYFVESLLHYWFVYLLGIMTTFPLSASYIHCILLYLPNPSNIQSSLAISSFNNRNLCNVCVSNSFWLVAVENLCSCSSTSWEYLISNISYNGVTMTYPPTKKEWERRWIYFQTIWMKDENPTCKFAAQYSILSMNIVLTTLLLCIGGWWEFTDIVIIRCSSSSTALYCWTSCGCGYHC